MPEARYLFYSVAQYVHERREERLNLGVVVHDPERRQLVARFAGAHATPRLKYLYPEIDRAGLELYIEEMANHLPNDRRVQAAMEVGNPLDILEITWQNIVQFTPARSYPAVSALAAADTLLRRYVTDAAQESEGVGTLGGVTRAKARIREAIRTVLQPLEGQLGVSTFKTERTWTGRDHREVKIPIEFPFVVLQTNVIDAVSLEAHGTREPFRQADSFIRKVENLRKVDRTMRAHAVVSVDAQRVELGRSLLEYIRSETGLDDDSVVETERAEVVAETIRRRAVA